tara:strand:- start:190 stop:438 length:249 start_codon:yes stop_codon:yes gene_type:complete
MLVKSELMDNNGALPIASLLGMFLGGFGVVVFFIGQSLTVFIPLLFAPAVCGTLCAILYKAHTDTTSKQEQKAPNPVRLDVI